MKVILLFSVVIVSKFCFSAVLPKAGCTISVNEHLSEPQPLLLLKNGATTADKAFPLPTDTEGTLVFNGGQQIDIACPGSSIKLENSNTKEYLLVAKCSSGVKFQVQGKTVKFSNITCAKNPYQTARYSGKKCGNNQYREIEIGFKIGSRFISHINSCFDDKLQNVLYTEFNLTSAIGGSQVNYPRPDNFIVGEFYKVSPDNLNSLYTRKGQRKTINTILGLPQDNTSVVHPSNNYFLAKGHYAAKSDFVYGTQHRLTFYYVNVAPQWQTFNGGNWKVLESNYRDLSSSRNLDLLVYTGSHGIATLPDVNGKEQPLYLWKRDDKKGIPVPAVFYKILYNPKNKAGVALIGVNNPYKKNIESYIYCKDVCNKIKWLSWSRNNTERGYSYCCDVNDFRKTVTILPKFQVKTLLT